MTSRRPIVFTVCLVLILGVGAWYQFAGRRVPPGQVPLTAISPASLDPLVEGFNRGSNEVRVVLLLSPT